MNGIVGVAASTAALLAGTLGPTGPATATPPSAEACTGQVGGDITMGVGSEIARGLDPAVALGSGTAGSTELAALYDTLMVYDAATGEISPNIALSAEPDDDFDTWTVTLRDDVLFASGNPLTAAAVAFNVERMAESTVAVAGMAQLVTDIDVVDDTTITFSLAQSWGSFPYYLAAEGGMIVDPAVVEAQGEDFALDPAGGNAGPYEVSTFEPGVELVLEARDDYWRGRPCLDTIRFTRISGGQATWEAFDNGELDVMFTLEPRPIAAAKEAGYPGADGVNGGYVYLLNSGRGDSPVFADVRLRQAVAHAIDPELIDERVNGGAGLPGNTLVDPSQRIFPDVAGVAYDPDAAAALVAEAEADGFDGVIRLSASDTPTDVERNIVVAALLEAVGFTVERQELPATEWLQKVLFDGDYDMASTSLTIFDEAPARGINQFASDSVRNRTGYADPVLDDLLDDLVAATDAAATRDVMAALQAYWNEHVPAVPIAQMNWYVAWQPELEGVTTSFASTVLFRDASLTGA